MRRRIWPGWIVLVLFLWLPAVALAQDGESQEPDEEVEADGPDEAVEADGADEEVEGDESDEADGAVEGDEPDEAVEGDEPDEGDEAVEGDEPAGDDPDEVVEGPGGRELTSDYPGTDESLQPRMDTSRIEGLDIPEGQDPEEVYDLRVRELETQIDDLKERVFRSKSRIALLRETILAENLAGSRAIVSFENDLGSRYHIDRAIFSVDGSQVFSEIDRKGQIGSGDLVEVFTGAMAPGTHTISVILGLTGSSYGIFSYAEGYSFDLRFSCQFTAEEGRTTLVTVRSYRSGNVFTAHEDRPDGICQVSMVELNVEDIEDDETIPLE